MTEETNGRSFDELAKGLANGEVSRRSPRGRHAGLHTGDGLGCQTGGGKRLPHSGPDQGKRTVYLSNWHNSLRHPVRQHSDRPKQLWNVRHRL